MLSLSRTLTETVAQLLPNPASAFLILSSDHNLLSSMVITLNNYWMKLFRVITVEL